MADKAAFELNMVRALFDAIPSLRQRSWHTSPNPEIDVIVALLNGGIVGVEVTRLHPTGGQETRRWEATHDAIVNSAQTKYESKDLPNVEVVVFWSAYIDPTRMRRDKIADDLVAFVSAHTPPAGEAWDFDASDENPRELPHAIDRILVRRLLGYADHWHSPRGAFPAEVSVSKVQESLSAKERKLNKYRESYDEVWLLLVVGSEGPSTWGVMHPELGHVEFTSSFDRVFIVSAPQSAIELRLRPGP